MCGGNNEVCPRRLRLGGGGAAESCCPLSAAWRRRVAHAALHQLAPHRLARLISAQVHTTCSLTHLHTADSCWRRTASPGSSPHRYTLLAHSLTYGGQLLAPHRLARLISAQVHTTCSLTHLHTADSCWRRTASPGSSPHRYTLLAHSLTYGGQLLAPHRLARLISAQVHTTCSLTYIRRTVAGAAPPRQAHLRTGTHYLLTHLHTADSCWRRTASPGSSPHRYTLLAHSLTYGGQLLAPHRLARLISAQVHTTCSLTYIRRTVAGAAPPRQAHLRTGTHYLLTRTYGGQLLAPHRLARLISAQVHTTCSLTYIRRTVAGAAPPRQAHLRTGTHYLSLTYGGQLLAPHRLARLISAQVHTTCSLTHLHTADSCWRRTASPGSSPHRYTLLAHSLTYGGQLLAPHRLARLISAQVHTTCSLTHLHTADSCWRRTASPGSSPHRYTLLAHSLTYGGQLLARTASPGSSPHRLISARRTVAGAAPPRQAHLRTTHTTCSLTYIRRTVAGAAPPRQAHLRTGTHYLLTHSHTYGGQLLAPHRLARLISAQVHTTCSLTHLHTADSCWRRTASPGSSPHRYTLLAHSLTYGGQLLAPHRLARLISAQVHTTCSLTHLHTADSCWRRTASPGSSPHRYTLLAHSLTYGGQLLAPHRLARLISAQVHTTCSLTHLHTADSCWRRTASPGSSPHRYTLLAHSLTYGGQLLAPHRLARLISAQVHTTADLLTQAHLHTADSCWRRTASPGSSPHRYTLLAHSLTYGGQLLAPHRLARLISAQVHTTCSLTYIRRTVAGAAPPRQAHLRTGTHYLLTHSLTYGGQLLAPHRLARLISAQVHTTCSLTHLHTADSCWRRTASPGSSPHRYTLLAHSLTYGGQLLAPHRLARLISAQVHTTCSLTYIRRTVAGAAPPRQAHLRTGTHYLLTHSLTYGGQLLAPHRLARLISAQVHTTCSLTYIRRTVAGAAPPRQAHLRTGTHYLLTHSLTYGGQLLAPHRLARLISAQVHTTCSLTLTYGGQLLAPHRLQAHLRTGTHYCSHSLTYGGQLLAPHRLARLISAQVHTTCSLTYIRRTVAGAAPPRQAHLRTGTHYLLTHLHTADSCWRRTASPGSSPHRYTLLAHTTYIRRTVAGAAPPRQAHLRTGTHYLLTHLHTADSCWRRTASPGSSPHRYTLLAHSLTYIRRTVAGAAPPRQAHLRTGHYLLTHLHTADSCWRRTASPGSSPHRYTLLAHSLTYGGQLLAPHRLARLISAQVHTTCSHLHTADSCWRRTASPGSSPHRYTLLAHSLTYGGQLLAPHRLARLISAQVHTTCSLTHLHTADSCWRRTASPGSSPHRYTLLAHSLTYGGQLLAPHRLARLISAQVHTTCSLTHLHTADSCWRRTASPGSSPHRYTLLAHSLTYIRRTVAGAAPPRQAHLRTGTHYLLTHSLTYGGQLLAPHRLARLISAQVHTTCSLTYIRRTVAGAAPPRQAHLRTGTHYLLTHLHTADSCWRRTASPGSSPHRYTLLAHSLTYIRRTVAGAAPPRQAHLRTGTHYLLTHLHTADSCWRRTASPGSSPHRYTLLAHSLTYIRRTVAGAAPPRQAHLRTGTHYLLTHSLTYGGQLLAPHRLARLISAQVHTTCSLTYIRRTVAGAAPPRQAHLRTGTHYLLTHLHTADSCWRRTASPGSSPHRYTLLAHSLTYIRRTVAGAAPPRQAHLRTGSLCSPHGGQLWRRTASPGSSPHRYTLLTHGIRRTVAGAHRLARLISAQVHTTCSLTYIRRTVAGAAPPRQAHLRTGTHYLLTHSLTADSCWRRTASPGSSPHRYTLLAHSLTYIRRTVAGAAPPRQAHLRTGTHYLLTHLHTADSCWRRTASPGSSPHRYTLLAHSLTYIRRTVAGAAPPRQAHLRTGTHYLLTGTADTGAAPPRQAHLRTGTHYLLTHLHTADSCWRRTASPGSSPHRYTLLAHSLTYGGQLLAPHRLARLISAQVHTTCSLTYIRRTVAGAAPPRQAHLRTGTHYLLTHLHTADSCWRRTASPGSSPHRYTLLAHSLTYIRRTVAGAAPPRQAHLRTGTHYLLTHLHTADSCWRHRLARLISAQVHTTCSLTHLHTADSCWRRTASPGSSPHRYTLLAHSLTYIRRTVAGAAPPRQAHLRTGTHYLLTHLHTADSCWRRTASPGSSPHRYTLLAHSLTYGGQLLAPHRLARLISAQVHTTCSLTYIRRTVAGAAPPRQAHLRTGTHYLLTHSLTYGGQLLAPHRLARLISAQVHTTCSLTYIRRTVAGAAPPRQAHLRTGTHYLLTHLHTADSCWRRTASPGSSPHRYTLLAHSLTYGGQLLAPHRLARLISAQVHTTCSLTYIRRTVAGAAPPRQAHLRTGTHYLLTTYIRRTVAGGQLPGSSPHRYTPCSLARLIWRRTASPGHTLLAHSLTYGGQLLAPHRLARLISAQVHTTCSLTYIRRTVAGAAPPRQAHLRTGTHYLLTHLHTADSCWRRTASPGSSPHRYTLLAHSLTYGGQLLAPHRLARLISAQVHTTCSLTHLHTADSCWRRTASPGSSPHRYTLLAHSLTYGGQLLAPHRLARLISAQVHTTCSLTHLHTADSCWRRTASPGSSPHRYTLLAHSLTYGGQLLAPHRLARLISAQILERLSMAHEKYQSALTSLEAVLAGRLHHTEDIKLAIRKKSIPAHPRIVRLFGSVVQRHSGAGPCVLLLQERRHRDLHAAVRAGLRFLARIRIARDIVEGTPFYLQGLPQNLRDLHAAVRAGLRFLARIRIARDIVEGTPFYLQGLPQNLRDLHAAVRAGLRFLARIRIARDIVEGTPFSHKTCATFARTPRQDTHRPSSKVRHYLQGLPQNRRPARRRAAGLRFLARIRIARDIVEGTPFYLQGLPQNLRDLHAAVRAGLRFLARIRIARDIVEGTPFYLQGLPQNLRDLHAAVRAGLRFLARIRIARDIVEGTPFYLQGLPQNLRDLHAAVRAGLRFLARIRIARDIVEGTPFYLQGLPQNLRDLHAAVRAGLRFLARIRIARDIVEGTPFYLQGLPQNLRDLHAAVRAGLRFLARIRIARDIVEGTPFYLQGLPQNLRDLHAAVRAGLRFLARIRIARDIVEGTPFYLQGLPQNLRDLHAAVRAGLRFLARIRIARDIVEGTPFYLQGLPQNLRDLHAAVRAGLRFLARIRIARDIVEGTPFYLQGLPQNLRDLHAAVRAGLRFLARIRIARDIVEGTCVLGTLSYLQRSRHSRIKNSCGVKSNEFLVLPAFKSPSLFQGLRPERLPHFTDECWEVMESCWASEPSQRALLGDVQTKLEKIHEMALSDTSLQEVGGTPVYEDSDNESLDMTGIDRPCIN
ncbi:hypothetical protein HF086_017599 [Spodoptera exigua]|uniref:Uncharacterized protein n=1 Tax=Spodoptera exigua TaxID=7107 RepID=A0A922MJV0_SPOEX|nr:hypothetical protein HF086_017599 [Spodoptera exigua]